MMTEPDYTAIEGEVNQLRCLLDLTESAWHEKPDSSHCFAALKAAVRLADKLHLTCCQFEFEGENS